MKHKFKKIISLCLLLFLVFNLFSTYSSYMEIFNSNCNLQISSPMIHIISDSISIDVLDENTYFNEFKIVNYDNNQKCKVNLTYKISISTNMVNAPLIFTLYKVDPISGNETIVDLKESFYFTANTAEIHIYKLAISYDFSYEELDENTKVFINLETTQI